MIRLGEKQDLTVVKLVDFGVYLASEEDMEDKVLLPRKQVPEGTKEGDVLCVFVYRDSKDRLIATTHEVRLTLGEVALLEVSQVGKIGAFLDGDWRRTCSFRSGNRQNPYRKGKTALWRSILTRATAYVRR